MKRTLVVAVLGIDGSGKTTVSRLLAQQLSDSAGVCLVSDTLSFLEQGRQKEILAPPSESVRHLIGRYAQETKSLKNYKIPKLVELLLRDHVLQHVVKKAQPAWVVADGSPVLNMVAWAVLYKQHRLDEAMCAKTIAVLTGQDAEIPHDDPLFLELPELSHLRRLRLTNLVLPDAVFLLDVSPETACRRVEARAKTRQAHETSDALAKLRGAYITVCDAVRQRWQIPFCRLDGEDQPEAIARTALAFLQQTFHTEPR